MRAEIAKSDRELHEAAGAVDIGPLRALMQRRALSASLERAELVARLASAERTLAVNPFDVEAQRVVEEHIAEQNIAANRDLA
jgi:hypothetical protein